MVIRNIEELWKNKKKNYLSSYVRNIPEFVPQNIGAAANRQAVKKKSFYKFHAWHYSAGEG